MDVKEFVAETLKQVMDGVAEAQKHAREVKGYVNPTAHSVAREGQGLGFTADGQVIYAMTFDIAVSVSSEKSAEAGAKLQVAQILKIGGEGKGTWAQESVSRVQFAVPMVLPVDEDSNTASKDRRAKAKAPRQSGMISHGLGGY